MRFSAGKALSDSFAILTGRFAPMAAIAAVLYLLPMVLFLYHFQNLFGHLTQLAQPDMDAMLATLAGMAGTLGLVYLAYFLLRIIGGAAMTVVAGEDRPRTISEALTEGARALLPLVGVYLLTLVAFAALGLVFFLAVGASMFPAIMGGQSSPGGGTIASIFLMILVLMVAVIYLACRLSMILPVIALGRERNPINAIAGSWRMTKGASLKIFLLFVLFAFAGGILNTVATGLTGGFSLEPVPLAGPMFWTQIAVSALMDALFGIYAIALLVAIYRQLAGPSTEAVSETFA